MNKFKEHCRNNPEWAKNEDDIGRNTCKKYIPKIFGKIKYLEDHPNMYDIDLIGYDSDDEQLVFVEAEHSNAWKGDDYYFKTLHVPERKRKFFNKYPMSLYVMVNKQASSIAVVRGDHILDSPMKEVPNKYNKSGEYFFNIDLNNVKFYKLGEVGR